MMPENINTISDIEIDEIINGCVDGVHPTSQEVSMALEIKARRSAEARTLTVKLPDYSEFAIVHFTGCSDDYAKGWVDGKNTVGKAYATACAAAGITLKVGGEDAQG